MSFNFDTTYSKLNSNFFSYINLKNIENPQLLILNNNLLNELNINEPEEELIQILSGNKLLEKPIAQRYAGHQFGYLNNLGDGRAALLGEHVTSNKRVDIQLKGSGITPYSRGGDGLLTLNSALREYVFSTALTNLNIKSSQSLAVILTNNQVVREEIQRGAILTRVMDSHIRVGTFEFVSYSSSKEELKEFTDYVIKRHFIEIAQKNNKYTLLLEKVMMCQIDMVINWIRVGFVHGVMNTDNMSITGETFDYGPCAFMNSYNLNTKFSRVDTQGRYAFGNQKNILLWNLERFAETLISIIDEEPKEAIKLLEKSLSKFEDIYEEKFNSMMKAKLGIKEEINCDNIIKKFLNYMQKNQLDYTNTFIELEHPGTFNDKKFQLQSFQNLRQELKEIGLDSTIMKKANPNFIPRNYLVEEVIDEYVKNNDLTYFNQLLEVLENPYEINKKHKKYQQPPKKEYDLTYTTHCNT